MVSILDVMGYTSLPELTKPKDIYRYMTALQVKAYGEAISLPYNVTIRNLKILIKEYGAPVVVRGIFEAVHASDFPFSTAFVHEMILQRKANELCSPLKTYVKTSDLNK